MVTKEAKELTVTLTTSDQKLLAIILDAIHKGRAYTENNTQLVAIKAISEGKAIDENGVDDNGNIIWGAK